MDTDILVDILRGHAPAVDWFAGMTQLPSVPGLVVMELIQDADSTERMDRAMKLVAPLPVVWPREPTATGPCRSSGPTTSRTGWDFSTRSSLLAQFADERPSAPSTSSPTKWCLSSADATVRALTPHPNRPRCFGRIVSPVGQPWMYPGGRQLACPGQCLLRPPTPLISVRG